jgi:hypothetical protein
MSDDDRAEFTRLSLTIPWAWDGDPTNAPNALAGAIIEIRHFGIHPTGGYKSPQFKRRRTDKEEAR